MSYNESDWEPPLTMAIARAERRATLAEIQDIQRDLGDRLKREAMGWDKAQYLQWRKGAQSALDIRLEYLRLTNDWIRENA